MSEQNSTRFSGGKPGVYHFAKGEPNIPAKDVSLAVTLNGLVKWVEKNGGLVRAGSNFPHGGPPLYVVDNDHATITFKRFICGGSYCANELENYDPQVTITGRLPEADDYTKLKAILHPTMHRPHDLGLKLRELRRYFTDDDRAALVVGNLRSAKHHVQTILEDQSRDDGFRKKSMEAWVDNAPEVKFTMEARFYKGQPKVMFDLELLYEVRDGGVLVSLYSAELDKLLTKQREGAMDATLKALAALTPEIAFVEV